ncbi:2-oxo-4-hydroxy-4-carboxy-5-ureidoimidazoline decarboxylase isoform X2 [Eurytemora carolleeae]|uniref:2-oxo-4-hydroxy-4-carboxy-5-ureidoimidazoline decarboxylase isoform X2 n=1 Tax=Eurytemora carolleeae TaxID=1294199 RepID=UPI000C7715A3|nr:2-oxo-4-hydroxy-4-carboxy-5-ureidoimidazoline decarboxylase isoform X2 [Eurytemora carolleeae]|eukprot:XP_023324309.1 2-oxo-4-hydroxy-4-carboxy-5-ureidoimidazoline decarboxylase-like isoform X2 [Eurytemora affinis]
METINNLSSTEFCRIFENIVEHSPMVGEELDRLRPFSSSNQFLQLVDIVIKSLPNCQKIEILEKHPDLAGKLADSNLLTPESTREQKAAGLDLMSPEQKQKIVELNNVYSWVMGWKWPDVGVEDVHGGLKGGFRSQFGFTFVVCARENKADSILRGLDGRVLNTAERELEIGINEVSKIARLRAQDILSSYQSKL